MCVAVPRGGTIWGTQPPPLCQAGQCGVDQLCPLPHLHRVILESDPQQVVHRVAVRVSGGVGAPALSLGPILSAWQQCPLVGMEQGGRTWLLVGGR